MTDILKTRIIGLVCTAEIRDGEMIVENVPVYANLSGNHEPGVARLNPGAQVVGFVPVPFGTYRVIARDGDKERLLGYETPQIDHPMDWHALAALKGKKK